MLAGYATSSYSLELSLDETTALALKNNFNLQQDAIAVDIRKYRQSIQKSKFIPVVELDSSYHKLENDNIFTLKKETHNNSVAISQELPLGGKVKVSYSDGNAFVESFGLSSSEKTDSYLLSFQYRQPLLKGGLASPVFVGIRKAEKEYEARDLERQDAVISLLYNVKKTYFFLLRLLEGRKVKAEALHVSENALELLHSRFEMKLSPEIESIFAQVERDKDAEALLIADQDVLATNKQLQKLLAIEETISPTDSLIFSYPVPSFERLLDIAWANNILLQRNRKGIEINELDVKSAKSNLLPQLDVVFEMRRSDYDERFSKDSDYNEDEYQVGLLFVHPLFNLGSRKTYEISRAEKNILRVQSRQIKHEIRIALAEALGQLMFLTKRIALLDGQAANTRIRLNLVSKAFDEGLVDPRVLYDARDDLLVIENRRLAALSEKWNAWLMVESILGISLQTSQ